MFDVKMVYTCRDGGTTWPAGGIDDLGKLPLNSMKPFLSLFHQSAASTEPMLVESQQARAGSTLGNSRESKRMPWGQHFLTFNLTFNQWSFNREWVLT